MQEFTEMSENSMVSPEIGKSSVGVAHAKTSLVLESSQELTTEIDRLSGGKCSESLTNLDLNLSSGKTLQDRLNQELEKWLPACEWLDMVATARSSLRQRRSEWRKEGNGSLLLPTPMALSKPPEAKYRKPGQDKLEIRLRELGLLSSGNVSNPEFREWLMGFPVGWTNPTVQVDGFNLPSILESLDEEAILDRIGSKRLGTVVPRSKQLSLGCELNTLPSGVVYLNIKDIRVDERIQSRDRFSTEHVGHLLEVLEDGDTLDPVVLFYDGETYWLADGFHRHRAYKIYYSNRPSADRDISCTIRQGSRRDAILYSVGANAEHKTVIRRSNADKRKAVMMLLKDEEWKQWSDREIARQCKVSNPFVSAIRKNITDTTCTTPVNINRCSTDTTNATPHTSNDRIYNHPHHGTARQSISRSKKQAEPDPEPSPEPIEPPTSHLTPSSWKYPIVAELEALLQGASPEQRRELLDELINLITQIDS